MHCKVRLESYKVIQIALLLCEERNRNFNTSLTYPDYFNDLFSKCDINFRVDVYDMQKTQYPKDIYTYDAAVLTGSRCDSFAATDWIISLRQYIKEIWENPRENAPVLFGVCFGHQIIAKALGGETARNPNGWEIGHTEIKLEPWARSFFTRPATLAADPSILRLQEVHQDIVTVPPPSLGILVYASTPATSIQGMIRIDKHGIANLFTTQAHPELPAKVIANIYEKRKCQTSQSGTLENRYPETDHANISCIPSNLAKHVYNTNPLDVEIFAKTLGKFLSRNLPVS